MIRSQSINVITKVRQQPQCPPPPHGGGSGNPAETGPLPARTIFGSLGSFTLIELLAVCVVIALLAAITIGIATSVRQKMERTQTQADIAGLSLAIESYKNDTGSYPTSSLVRSSCINPGSGLPHWTTAEVNNSGLLLAQLLSGSKSYYRFRKDQTNPVTASVPTNSIPYWPSATMKVIVDRWGTPLNYYCTYPPKPTPTYSSVGVVGSWYVLYITGGQMNVASFDLWSYGPDSFTYVPIAGWSGANDWNHSTYAVDDLTNWKR